VKELKTSLDRGLTKDEAENRLKEYGQNQLEKEEEESLWDKIKESFEDLLVRILLLAAVISFIIAIFGKYYGFYSLRNFRSNFRKFEKNVNLIFRIDTLTLRDYVNLRYWSLK
jgi:magnesium-transporting ATPase (P-type)